MKYNINNNQFRTKAEITKHYREILYRNDGGRLSGKDFHDVLSLLSFHTESDEKIGCGIKEIKVEYHVDLYAQYQTHSKHPHFHLYRHDGTNIDFSFSHCIKAINNENIVNSTLKTNVKDAFRNSIAEQVIEFKQKAFTNMGYYCENTNQFFT